MPNTVRAFAMELRRGVHLALVAVVIVACSGALPASPGNPEATLGPKRPDSGQIASIDGANLLIRGARDPGAISLEPSRSPADAPEATREWLQPDHRDACAPAAAP
jgi:hypothetical protein